MLANFKDDLKELARDFPSVLLYGTLKIKCVASDIQAEVLVEPDGNYNPKMKDVLAAISDFRGTIPPAKATVTLDGIKMYVDDTETDALTDTIRLTLKRM